MRTIVIESSYEGWRRAARSALADSVAPAEVTFRSADTEHREPSLFQHTQGIATPVGDTEGRFTVPRAFVTLAEQAACHRDERRWDLLYRVLWRIVNGERALLEVATDADVQLLIRMAKNVARDEHKMHAFVRFRQQQLAGVEWLIAWYRPDHLILERAAPFFVRRFGSLRWAILTPDGSASWDLESLSFGPPVPTSPPGDDAVEALWKDYYASVFNPARLKVRTMKREMPVRFWGALPEAALVPELVHGAAARTVSMEQRAAAGAAAFIGEARTLVELAGRARACRGCSLYARATSVVFGEGAPDARLVLIGEQPGDEEDRRGAPFVGPAGELLDQALESAAIDRRSVYVTNAVKHFKFTERGKQRIHQRPSGTEVNACKPWLEAELRAIGPDVVVCLGGTAARAILGREVRIGEERGQPLRHGRFIVVVTAHPASVLRSPPEAQAAALGAIISDLATAAALVREREGQRGQPARMSS